MMGIQLTDDPAAVLRQWFDEAQAGRETDAAMALATVGDDGQPSLRIVLCRGIEADGSVVFYTNYRSRKASELEARPVAAATFHFIGQGRQVRLEGTTERVSEAMSDAYFGARSRESQIGAWASPQSQPITDGELQQRWEEMSARFEGASVPRPAWWGGYRLRPRVIELWRHGNHRLHDRVRFDRVDGLWQATRLGS